MLERLFQLKAHDTNVRTEILAGITTFLAMAYILFVNPSILGETGMDKGAVFVATCLAAAIGSAVIAAVSLFNSFIVSVGSGGGGESEIIGGDVYAAVAAILTISDPKLFIGMLIGGAIPFLFSSMTIRAVGRKHGKRVDMVSPWITGALGWAFFGPLGGLLGYAAGSFLNSAARVAAPRRGASNLRK